ncbi:hypothetical protein [Rhodanobacter lindaniclasticus]
MSSWKTPLAASASARSAIAWATPVCVAPGALDVGVVARVRGRHAYRARRHHRAGIWRWAAMSQIAGGAPPSC